MGTSALSPNFATQAQTFGNVSGGATQALAGYSTTTIQSFANLLATVEFNQNNGILTIQGSDESDNVYAQRNGSQLELTVNGVIESFDFSDVSMIRFLGGDGNDQFNNRTSIVSRAWGGNGVDRLLGGSGNDLFVGGMGADFIRGGAGDDLLRGGGAPDKIIGDAGNDILEGQGHNDSLYGRSGSDILRGGGGMDGLFGGLDSDTLVGGNSADRFLFQSGDTISDQTESDARLVFSNDNIAWTDVEVEVVDGGLKSLHMRTASTRLLKDSFPSGDLTFEKSNSLGGAVGMNTLSWRTYYQWNYEIGDWEVTSIDYTRLIEFSDWNEGNVFQNADRVDTMIHEIGHNWDGAAEIGTVLGSSAEAIWNDFLAVSGWVENPANTEGMTNSADGQWWYSSDAEFVRNYGRTNPYEDWATVWEEVFKDETVSAEIQQKFDIVNSLFDQL